MLIDALLDFIGGIVAKFGAALASLVPPVPSWVSQASGMISTVLGYATALGNWVPVGIFGVVVASVVVCLIAGLAIKIARIGASFGTLGGGSAG